MTPGILLRFSLLLSILLYFRTATAAPVVTCPWGQVSGLDLYSPGNVLYYGYLGLRYGIGTRFQRASAARGPTAGRSAVSHGPACPQVFQSLPWSPPPINEDCLYLDVYVPGGTTLSDAHPVMVYFHGGGFSTGHVQDYDPWKMVAEGRVIVVTAQYRLGPLGFASTGDSVLPGNLGLWDQRLAIQWVRDNIRNFGGDVSTLTLIGQDAGAASVGFHMLTNVASGQFARGILVSGSPNAAWAFQRDPLPLTLALARHLGCITNDDPYERLNKATLFGCMKTTPLSGYLSFNDSMTSMFGESGYFQSWAPTVDNEFVFRDPRDAMADPDFLRSMDFYDRDVMIGVDNNEGSTVLKGNVPPSQQPSYQEFSFFQDTFLPGLVRTFYRDVEPNLGATLAFFYTSPSHAPALVSPEGLFNSLGDFAFVSPAVEMARAHSRNSTGTGRTNVYLFDHNPNASVAQGIPHGMELGYFFGLDHKYMLLFGLQSNLLPATEFQLANEFTSLMTQFARNGIEWTEFGVGEFFLSISTVKIMKQYMYQDRVALWLDLVPAVQARWQARTLPSPCVSPPDPRFKYFPLSLKEGEVAFIGILSGGVFLVILLVFTWCLMCNKKEKEDKYRMRS